MAELFALGHGLHVKHEQTTVQRCAAQYPMIIDVNRRCIKDEGHGGTHIYEFFGADT